MKPGPLSILAAAVPLAFFPACAQREGAAAPPTAQAAPSSVRTEAASQSAVAASPSAPSTPPVQPAQPSAPASGRETASAPASRPYPMTTCAINGRDFGKEPKHRRAHQGQEVLFCCTPCVRSFDAAPEAFMPSILARVEAHYASGARAAGTVAAGGAL